MSNRKRLWYGALVAGVVASSLAFAAGNEEQYDAAALAQAKVSLAQAIAAAEQHANGKAVRAELEDENGTFVYGVEVINGTKVTDVKVDIRDGRILSAQADPDEHESLSGEREDRNERGDK